MLLATLPPTARVAVIDESRALTAAPSSARVVLPSGPSQPHAGATLVAEALRREPAWVVLASLLLDEWPTLVRAIAASRVRALATVPVAHALEPATLVEVLALHLTTAGVELDEARQVLAHLAPLVVLTETLPAAVGTAERWRVRGIVGLGGAPGNPEVVELW